MHVDNETRRKLRNRLRRANGQLAGVERALDETDDCIDLLNQLAAVEGALAKARAVLLTHHIESCVAGALESGDAESRDVLVDELMDVIGKQLGR